MSKEKFSRIEDPEIARQAAEAEKPLRDAARLKDTLVSEGDKRDIDKVAEKLGGKKFHEIEGKRQQKEREEVRQVELQKWRDKEMNERVEKTGLYEESVYTPKLKFSTRAYSTFAIGDIHTIGQLTQKTRKDLLKIKHTGVKTIDEIENVLNSVGLKLGMKYINSKF